jgi:3-hydroxyisobutyrate dehydrogenase-like beta-hydroxyacid dehydrogenase
VLRFDCQKDRWYRSGIDPAVFFNALNYNVAKSGLADLKQPKYMSGDYSPQFSIKHMHKDLRLALAHAKSLDLTLAETTTVQGLYAEAEKRGFGDLDFAALLDLVRNP